MVVQGTQCVFFFLTNPPLYTVMMHVSTNNETPTISTLSGGFKMDRANKHHPSEPAESVYIQEVLSFRMLMGHIDYFYCIIRKIFYT